ncbi:hypothetical protein [Neisseria animalis]|uniref:hypothetical protein n=1 Tax=Neisseria animalis TaxID=492 RepID=UPI000F512064|nr:hypothetical protein [Neisseria animalis]
MRCQIHFYKPLVGSKAQQGGSILCEMTICEGKDAVLSADNVAKDDGSGVGSLFNAVCISGGLPQAWFCVRIV